jgi:hypothetical protein
MKLRWSILLGCVLAVIATLITAAVVVVGDIDGLWPIAALMVGFMLLVFFPAVAFVSIAHATFDIDSPDGKAAVRKITIFVAGIQLVGAAAFIAVAAGAPSVAAIVVGTIMLSAVLTLAGIPLALRIKRREIRPEPGDAPGTPWTPWTPAERRRKIRLVVRVFVITAVAASAIVLVLGTVYDEPFSLVVLAFSLMFGFIAATFACIVIYWPMIEATRGAAGNDLAEQKLMYRVILQGKGTIETDEGRRRAAIVAGIRAQYMPFQIAQTCLLFAGLFAQQLATVLSGTTSRFSGFSLGFVIVVPLVITPLVIVSVRQLRRVREYAAAHGG